MPMQYKIGFRSLNLSRKANKHLPELPMEEYLPAPRTEEPIDLFRRWLPQAEHQRFIRRMCKRITVDPERGCWLYLWAGPRLGSYPGGVIGGKRVWSLHLDLYKMLHGPLPEPEPPLWVRYVIDHRCANKLCINPDHLQAVTNSMNVKLGNWRRWRSLGVSMPYPVYPA